MARHSEVTLSGKRKDFCVMCALEKHICTALKPVPESVMAPKLIVTHIKGICVLRALLFLFLTFFEAIAKHFRIGRQEDAHEFLRYFIEGLQKSCLPPVAGYVAHTTFGMQF